MPFNPALSTCPICQKQEKFSFVKDHQNKDGKFSLYECPNCEIQFWTPFQNPGKDWYEKEYDYKARNILISKSYRNCHKRFLDRFKSFPENTKILDIGCGIGEFLAELQERGAEVWGVDFNQYHTDIAKNKFGLKNIYTMDFIDFLKREDLPKFDIVTFFGMLEHIDNPLELVQEVKRILKLGGILASSAPSKDNLVTGLSSKDIPPDHLSQWNKKAISTLFQKIDFGIYYIEYVDWFGSFKSVISEKFRMGLVDKTAKTLDFSGKKRQRNIILLKIIHLLGDIRDYVIGGIPAAILFAVTWLIGRKGGTMFVLLKQL